VSQAIATRADVAASSRQPQFRGRVHPEVRANYRESVRRHLRIDTPQEVRYYQHGGILPYVLRQMV